MKEYSKMLFNCERCGQPHEIDVDSSKLTAGQIAGKEPIIDNFVCPDVATMFRVLNFNVDTRSAVFKIASAKDAQDQLANELMKKWGAEDFENKLQRFTDLDVAFLGIPEEYYDLLIPIIDSYCCGYFYPAMTGAGALGERILNRLVLKTRGHFKSSDHYKKIWNKNSFDDWKKAITILVDWGVISDDVADLFLKLNKFRNDSIHYNDDYDFEANSHEAVMALLQIIDLQFNYSKRKDIFWVFDIPGEIWVKSEMIDDPFVKEFVIPHCLALTPLDEPTTRPFFKEKGARLKPISDKEFIEIRRAKND